MKFLDKINIRSKLVLLSTLLVAMISVFMFLYFPNTIKKDKLHSIRDKAVTITDMTAYSISPGLVFGDIKSIEESIIGLKNNEDLVYLVVEDNKGKILISHDYNSARNASYRLNEEFTKDNRIIKISKEINNLSLSTERNSYHPEREILGRLYIGFSLKDMHNEVNNSIFSIAIISVLVFIAGFGFIYLISTVITNPIKRILNTIDEISFGDLSGRVAVTTDDEIGRLGNSFNLLVSKLEQSYNNLQSLNNDLQLRIATQIDLIRTQEELSDSLKKSEQQYRFLADNTVDLIWITDKQFRMSYITPSVEAILGYSIDEWMSFLPWDYYSADSYKMLKSVYEQELLKAENPGYKSDKPFTFEAQMIKKDKSMIWVENTVKAFQNEQNELGGIFVFTRDISERKEAEKRRIELEEQLMQTQKMESIGRLSGGIAHDLNNMLTPILGFAEILMHELQGDSKKTARVQNIINSVLNSRDLIKQLLAFARKQTLNSKPININKIITDNHQIISRTLKADISINYQLEDDLMMINADSIQIQQILINLCVNSQDAMPNGGVITIATKNIAISGIEAKRKEIETGNYILLKFCDSGSGMDKEVLEKVFEPFYTTKGLGKGTGLGLSTVYGIVKQQKGHIGVQSSVGVGTCFDIYFPAIESQSSEFIDNIVEHKNISGKETIFVVEDQSEVLEMISEYLEIAGYNVIASSEGNKAVELFSDIKDNVNLLITDIILPDINGKIVYDSMSKIKPDLNVLFMSGYSEDIITEDNVLKPGVNFIQKPFNLRDFGLKIREILDLA